MCWHRSGFPFPITDMSVLVSCCLLQVNANNRTHLMPDQPTLSMHDQLRDLAYSIVREENGSVAQRTRLLGRDAERALKTGVCPLASQVVVLLGDLY